MSLLKELWAFLRVRKFYWLMPILIVVALLGVLILTTQGSSNTPFTYFQF